MVAMGKPAILAVDDDQLVLAAIERDLRRKYGGEFQVIAAESGREALEVLDQLSSRGDPTALLVVDQRMPEMTGVEFLEASRRLDQGSRRVLLTGYADTEAAIAAINVAGVSFYIQKPWEPLEERLYPLLDDLLEQWKAGYRPPFSGIRVLGDRHHPETRRIRGFLARNLIPYQAIEAGGAVFSKRSGYRWPTSPLSSWKTGPACHTPTHRLWLRQSISAPDLNSTLTTSSSSAPVRRDWLLPSMPPRRGSKCWRLKPKHPAARQDRAPGSKITWASRLGSPGPS